MLASNFNFSSTVSKLCSTWTAPLWHISFDFKIFCAIEIYILGTNKTVQVLHIFASCMLFWEQIRAPPPPCWAQCLGVGLLPTGIASPKLGFKSPWLSPVPRGGTISNRYFIPPWELYKSPTPLGVFQSLLLYLIFSHNTFTDFQVSSLQYIIPRG